MRLFRQLSLLLGITLVYSCIQPQGINPDITKDELFAHIDFLSSDSLQGRLPGTPYDRVAAKYIKDQMEKSGFKLIGKNGYQFFSFITHQEVGPNNSLSIAGKKLIYGTDYTAFPFSSSDTLNTNLVFAGYGFNIQTDTLSWNDYQTIDANGKWVLILRGDPDHDKPNSFFSQYSDDRYKSMVAKDKGAAGVILISGVEFDAEDALTEMKQKSFDIGIPVIQMKRNIIDLILKPAGNGIVLLEKKLLETRKPSSFNILQSIAARTDIINSTKNSQNVVGMIEGTHPTLKNQYVIIGAHYDHLGMGGPGSSSRMPDTLAPHNGADDNASGVAAMLEIGQKLAKNKPSRSVLLIAFGAEEMGLIGSRYFTENPLVPLDSISVMINIDMLGRMNGENLQIGGYKTSVEMDEILNRIGESHQLELSLSPQGYGPSDHASFYSKDVPVLFISTGPHVDYHTPNDVIDRINFDGMLKAADFIYEIAHEVTNAKQMLTFQEAGPKQQPSRHGRELKVRLGIMPDVSGAGTDGLTVLAVTENQPAWYAGIKKGDRIISINGKSVGNIQDYMFRLSELKPGMTVNVEVVRDEKNHILLVQL